MNNEHDPYRAPPDQIATTGPAPWYEKFEARHPFLIWAAPGCLTMLAIMLPAALVLLVGWLFF